MNLSLRRDDRNRARPFAKQKDRNNQHHDHHDIQPDIHQVLIKLLRRYLGKVRQLGAGRENPPGAGDDADGKVRFQFQHFGLKKPHDGAKELQ